jgi:hypothetical protein
MCGSRCGHIFKCSGAVLERLQKLFHENSPKDVKNNIRAGVYLLLNMSTYLGDCQTAATKL